MNLETTRQELVKKVKETKDKAILTQLEAVFYSNDHGWYESAPDEIKAEIELASQEGREGKTISNAEMMKKFDEWLK